MKMHLRIYGSKLLFVLFLMALTSCTLKNGYLDKPELSESEIAFGDGSYELKFCIEKQQSALRAAESDPMKTIKELLFVFYSSPETAEKAEVVYSQMVTFNESLSTFVLKTNILPDNYKLLVIANPTDIMRPLFLKGVKLSELDKALEASGVGFLHYAAGSNNVVSDIAMSNDQGLIPLSKSNFTAAGASQDAITPIYVKLTPMLARLIVIGNPTCQVGTLAGCGQFVSNGIAKSVFLMRKPALLSNGKEEKSGDVSTFAERYAYGPDYETAKPTDATTISRSFLASLNNLSWHDILNDAPEKYYSNSFVYRKETTVRPGAYVKGALPHIVIKYRIIPNGLTLNANEGWVTFRGKHYSETAFKALLSAPDLPKKNPELYQTKIAIEKETPNFFKTFDRGYSRNGIDFYYRSENYYVIFIRHFGNDLAPNADSYGRYGLVRNNEYIIKVNGISTFGATEFIDLKDDMTPVGILLSSKIGINTVPYYSRKQEEVL